MTSPCRSHLRSMRILIAEPDGSLRRWLAGALRAQGAHVTTAQDTCGAMESAIVDPPCVAILSETLPALASRRLPRILRRLNPRMKVIQLSRMGHARRS